MKKRNSVVRIMVVVESFWIRLGFVLILILVSKESKGEAFVATSNLQSQSNCGDGESGKLEQRTQQRTTFALGKGKESTEFILSVPAPLAQWQAQGNFAEGDGSESERKRNSFRSGRRLRTALQTPTTPSSRRNLRNHDDGSEGNAIRNHIFQLRRPIRPVAAYDYGRPEKEAWSAPAANIPHDIRQRFFAPLPSTPEPTVNSRSVVQDSNLPRSGKPRARSAHSESFSSVVTHSQTMHESTDVPIHVPKTDWNSQASLPLSPAYHGHGISNRNGAAETDAGRLTAVHSKCQSHGQSLNESNEDVQLKKLMRSSMQLQCAQYINMRRIILLTNRKVDATEKQMKRMINSCSRAFAHLSAG